MNLNLDILGFVDDQITVNIIRGRTDCRKTKPSLPETITNIIQCKIPDAFLPWNRNFLRDLN